MAKIILASLILAPFNFPKELISEIGSSVNNFKNLINELDIKNLNYSNNFKSGNSYKLVSNFDKDLYTKSVLLYKKFNKNI